MTTLTVQPLPGMLPTRTPRTWPSPTSLFGKHTPTPHIDLGPRAPLIRLPRGLTPLDWETYTGDALLFEYPPQIDLYPLPESVLPADGSWQGVRLVHAIAYSHLSPCQVEPGADCPPGGCPVQQDEFIDFDLTILRVPLSSFGIISEVISGATFLSEVTNGEVWGEIYRLGDDLCGEDIYLLSLDLGQTLVLRRPIISAYLTPEAESFLALPGAIFPEEGEAWFAQILETVEVIPGNR